MLWAVDLDERPDDPQQTQITRFFQVRRILSLCRPAPVVRGGRRAAAWFWERLQDLVMLDEYPLKDQRWEGVRLTVVDYPFLGVADMPDRPEFQKAEALCCEHACCCAAGHTLTFDETLAFCFL